LSTTNDRGGGVEAALSRRARIALVCAGLAFAALIAASAASARAAHGRVFAGLFVDPQGSFSMVWWPSWGSERPPLRFPDHLNAIDGEPVGAARGLAGPGRELAARLARAEAAGRGSVDLTFQTKDGPTVLRRVLRRLGFEEELFFFGLYALMGVFVLWSGLAVVLLAGRRAGARAYAAYSVGTFVFMLTFYDYHSTARLAPLFSLSSVWVQVCILWLAYSFPEPPRNRPLLLAGLIALTAIEAVAAVAIAFGPAWGLDTLPLRLAVSFEIPIVIIVQPAAILLRLRGERGPRRRELVSSALGLAVTPAVVALGFLVVLLTGVPAVHLLLPFLAPMVPLSIGYALIRHNILATRSVLNRRLFVVPVLAGAAVAAIVCGLGLHAALASRSGSALLPGFGAALSLVAVGLIGYRASGRLFVVATARFRPTLQQLADDLASKSDRGEIRRAIVAAVTRWLPTRQADVIAPNELHHIANRPEKLRTRMEAGTAVWTTEAHWQRRLLVPMRSQGGLRGVLSLAPKHEGALYTREDLELLETIASLGAVALHNAEAFAELEAMRRLEAEAARDDKRLALGLLGAEVSHEIAYPLNFLRYLFREGQAGRAIDSGDLEAGREEIGRLERMFATLRKLKVPEPQTEPVLVLPRVRRAQDLIRETLEKKRIEIAVDVPPDLTLVAEADSLVQILANLLRNAAQAVAEGGRVGVGSQPTPEGGVVLEVWDEGPGLPAEVESSIFDPFVSTKPGSMGLGLAVTHRLVRSFGWSIGVRRLGGRTVFGIDIPPARAVGFYSEARS
jgi:signal transduction histidine kinase